MGGLLRLGPCDRLVAGEPLRLVHIRLDQARIDRERFASDKSRRNAQRHNCRYIIVGRKTPQSLRRVPLPASVLPFLPRRIDGRLFPGDSRAASKRLNRFLKRLGIWDRRKVLHSLRHRAQDRLRAAGCPARLPLGNTRHEKETVAAGYCEGFPVPLLKRWIDKIGF